MPHKIITQSILSFSNAVKSIWQIQKFLCEVFWKLNIREKVIFPCKKYYIYSIYKETGFVFILLKEGKRSLLSVALACIFPILIWSWKATVWLNLMLCLWVLPGREWKRLLQQGEHIYLLKCHVYYICNKSENMLEKTIHVLTDLSDELAVARIKNLKNTKIYMLVFGMLRNKSLAGWSPMRWTARVAQN